MAHAPAVGMLFGLRGAALALAAWPAEFLLAAQEKRTMRTPEGQIWKSGTEKEAL